MIVRFLIVFQEEKSHLKSQFLKVKSKQVSDKFQGGQNSKGADEGENATELSTIDQLEQCVSTQFLKDALTDYKELFLTPLKAKNNNFHGRSSNPGDEPVRQLSRHSHLKPTKEVIVLKSESCEKQETKDLAKFAS